MGEVKTSFGSSVRLFPIRATIHTHAYIYIYVQIHPSFTHSNQYAYISMWGSTFELEVLQCFSRPLHFFHLLLLLYLYLLLVFRFSSPASVKLHQCDGCIYGRILERIQDCFWMWNSHWLLKGHMVIWRMRMRDACEVARFSRSGVIGKAIFGKGD